jgi:electron transfer flavoprotein alpha subunit
VVDLGWLPRQLQIGITGKSIAPRVYLALALRGNLNHAVGIRRAGCVIAINSDPQAEIFRAADYGLVADYREVLPRLLHLLEKE